VEMGVCEGFGGRQGEEEGERDKLWEITSGVSSHMWRRRRQ